MDTKEQRNWTKEDLDTIKKLYGVYTIPYIATTLRCEIGALEKKIEREGLSYAINYRGDVTAHLLAKILNVDSHTVLRWINNKGLPHTRKVRVHERESILIEVRVFWNWIHANQSLMNFSKMTRGELLPEPEWLEDAVKRDFHAIPKKQKKPWTPEEDARIWQMFYVLNYTQEKIGELEGRSRRSVQKRLATIREKKASQDSSKIKDLNQIKFI
ncbi:hypothetical protein [Bacillus bombysepticus]|uniref:hypothetical protein n=1 Tax=Bacillus bombysepticus TaxID=658666 RepID=UPI003016BB0B